MQNAFEDIASEPGGADSLMELLQNIQNVKDSGLFVPNNDFESGQRTVAVKAAPEPWPMEDRIDYVPGNLFELGDHDPIASSIKQKKNHDPLASSILESSSAGSHSYDPSVVSGTEIGSKHRATGPSATCSRNIL